MEILFYVFMVLMIGIPLADTEGAKRNATLGESLSFLFVFMGLGLIALHIIGYGHMTIFGPVTVPSGFGS